MFGVLNESKNVLLENYIPSHWEENYYEGYSKLINEGINCDMQDSEFMNGDDTGVEDDDDNNFLGENWEWDQWAPIVDDYDVPIPPMNDRYSERNGLKPMVASIFDSILQSVFRCTATNHELFQILSCQQTKYAKDKMRQNNSNLFIGWKWKKKCSWNGQVL